MKDKSKSIKSIIAASTDRSKKIARIKLLVEQLEKETGKKIIFEDTKQQKVKLAKAKVNEINSEIKSIFNANKVKIGHGDEAFWIGVEDVEKKNKKDGKKLRSLADKWDKSFKELQNLER